MSVYVDASFWTLGRMKMCHLLADTEEELNSFASSLGLKASWRQTSPVPHYDLSKSKRTEAVKLGAIECDKRGIVAVMKRVRRKTVTTI
jgi:hypothetical protein